MRIIKQLSGYRIRTFFALLPITIIDNHSKIKETRWLEKVTVQEVYRDNSDAFLLVSYWEAVKFINN